MTKADRNRRRRARRKAKKASGAVVAVVKTVSAGVKRRRRARNARRRANRFAAQASLVDANQGAFVPGFPAVSPVGNPADPRSHSATAKMGSSWEAVSWTLRCLHPNGEGVSGGLKLPDGGMTKGLGAVRRDEWILAPPVDYPSDLNHNHWDVWIISFPAVYRHTVAVVPDPTITITPEEMYDSLADTIAIFWTNDDPASNPNYATAPAWSNRITSGGFGGAFWFSHLQSSWQGTAIPQNAGGTVQDASAFSNDYRAIRRVFAGLTCELVAPMTQSEGRITAGQFAPDHRIAALDRNEVELNAPNFSNVLPTSVIYEIPPVLPEDIMQLDPSRFAGPALDNVYMPLKPWKSEFPSTLTNRDYPAMYSYKGIRRGFVTNIPAPVANQARFDELPFETWGTSTIAFLGINTVASVRVIRQEGIEGAAHLRGHVTPFASPGLPADDMSMEFVKAFVGESPSAYPGCYNFLNGLLGSISSFANGIPIVGDLLKPVAGIAGGVIQSLVGGNNHVSLPGNIFGPQIQPMVPSGNTNNQLVHALTQYLAGQMTR